MKVILLKTYAHPVHGAHGVGEAIDVPKEEAELLIAARAAAADPNPKPKLEPAAAEINLEPEDLEEPAAEEAAPEPEKKLKKKK